MYEKVTVRVRLPALQRVLEFRVPWSLRVEQLIPLLVQLMRAQVEECDRMRADGLLMLLEGPQAGRILEGDKSVEELMREGHVGDGSELALI